MIQQSKKTPFLVSMLPCNQKSQSQAQFICINYKCPKRGLACRQQQCIKCIKQHKKCKLVRLQNIINKIELKIQSQKGLDENIKKSCEKMIKVYDDLIQMISIQRQNFTKWYDNYGLKQNQIIFIQAITTGEINFNGSLTHNVYKLPSKNEMPIININQIQQIQLKLKKHMTSIFPCLNNLYKLPNQQQKSQMRQNALQTFQKMFPQIISLRNYREPDCEEQEFYFDLFD